MREVASEHYLTMPKSVRIGCYDFEICVMDSCDAESNREFGHINYLNQKIRIRPGMLAQKLANTFLHEVMHGIFLVQNVNCGENEEHTQENFVIAAANGLCAFWQNNKETTQWWSRLITIRP